MKNFKQLVLVFLVATATLVSCNKDDDSSSAAIEGKWEYTQETNELGVLEDYSHTVGCNKDYVEILAGGVLNDVYYETYADVVCDESIYTAAWSRSGNTLTVTGFGESNTAEILELTQTTLKVKYTDPDDGSTYITVHTRR